MKVSITPTELDGVSFLEDGKSFSKIILDNPKLRAVIDNRIEDGLKDSSKYSREEIEQFIMADIMLERSFVMDCSEDYEEGEEDFAIKNFDSLKVGDVLFAFSDALNINWDVKDSIYTEYLKHIICDNFFVLYKRVFCGTKDLEFHAVPCDYDKQDECIRYLRKNHYIS